MKLKRENRIEKLQKAIEGLTYLYLTTELTGADHHPIKHALEIATRELAVEKDGKL